MTEIDKAYILRLYAIHERVMDAAHDLNIELIDGEPLNNPDSLIRIADDLDRLTDEMEKIFAETLTDEERDIPTDEECARMVNVLLGRESKNG